MIKTIERLFRADRFARELGIEIELIEKARARASVEIVTNMLNGAGVANGGVVYTLADYVLAIAANTMGENISLTLNLSINYNAPAKEGDVLQAEALIKATSGRTASAEVTVNNQRGEVIAMAQGLAYATARPKPTD